MATVYFSIRDYRDDMRNPSGSARSHAACRKLIATARQESLYYGAHYWAACGAFLDKPNRKYAYHTFSNEVTGGNAGRFVSKTQRRLFALAWVRMMRVR